MRPSYPDFPEDEEHTRDDLRRPLRAVSLAPEADELELLGRVMATTARLEAAVARLEVRVSSLAMLPSEVRSLRDEILEDREALVHGASKHAANHSSNRMAALMGALFTLYEVSSPYLRDLFHWWVHR